MDAALAMQMNQALSAGRLNSLPTHLGQVFDLTWIDPALHSVEYADNLADYERKRRFAHCGAAIAWARRQIFHGKVFGEHIEMATVDRYEEDGEIRESVGAAVDITLPGFRKWDWVSNYKREGISLGKPERKCRIAT